MFYPSGLTPGEVQDLRIVRGLHLMGLVGGPNDGGPDITEGDYDSSDGTPPDDPEYNDIPDDWTDDSTDIRERYNNDV